MSYTPPLLAEKTAFITTTPLASGATFTATIIDVDGYTQVQTEVRASHDGTITVEFCSDSACTDVVRSLSIPYLASSGYQFFSSPAFGNFIKYQFTNNGGVTQTDFYYTTKLLTTALSAQVLTTNAFIASSMVANLGRNVIVGQEGLGGSFENVSVTETINDAGTFHNLNVVSGARPSQLTGRLKVAEVANYITVSTLQRTITAGKTFYVTDLLLTIDNSDTGSPGRVNLRDGLTVAGAIILPILIQEAISSGSSTQVFLHTFSEPIQFSIGLFIEEGAGINTVAGTIIGYEE